jgi:hypothetical protein
MPALLVVVEVSRLVTLCLNASTLRVGVARRKDGRGQEKPKPQAWAIDESIHKKSIKEIVLVENLIYSP